MMQPIVTNKSAIADAPSNSNSREVQNQNDSIDNAGNNDQGLKAELEKSLKVISSHQRPQHCL